MRKLSEILTLVQTELNNRSRSILITLDTLSNQGDITREEYVLAENEFAKQHAHQFGGKKLPVWTNRTRLAFVQTWINKLKGADR